MTNALTLYGTLILTVLGFVVPILTLLISLFPQGTKALSVKYQNEKKQSDENIKNETKKRENDIDYDSLETTLKILKKQNKEAELKLQYLKLGQFLFRTASPFVAAFIAALIAFISMPTWLFIAVLVSSFVFFAIGSFNIFTSISVLFEVAEIVGKKQEANEEKIIELLSSLVEKNGDSLFVKEGDVRVRFDKKYLKEGEIFDYSVNTKHQISVSIENSGEKMAKNIEAGLIFPKDVVIEKTSNISLFPGDDKQIVRFNREYIQAREDNLQGSLSITFLNPGQFSIRTFIKGENVRYTTFNFKLNVVK